MKTKKDRFMKNLDWAEKIVKSWTPEKREYNMSGFPRPHYYNTEKDEE